MAVKRMFAIEHKPLVGQHQTNYLCYSWQRN